MHKYLYCAASLWAYVMQGMQWAWSEANVSMQLTNRRRWQYGKPHARGLHIHLIESCYIYVKGMRMQQASLGISTWWPCIPNANPRTICLHVALPVGYIVEIDWCNNWYIIIRSLSVIYEINAIKWLHWQYILIVHKMTSWRVQFAWKIFCNYYSLLLKWTWIWWYKWTQDLVLVQVEVLHAAKL